MGPDPVLNPHRGVELIVQSDERIAGRQHSKKHSHTHSSSLDRKELHHTLGTCRIEGREDGLGDEPVFPQPPCLSQTTQP